MINVGTHKCEDNKQDLMRNCHKKDLKLSPFGQLIQFDFYTSSQIMEKLYPLQHHYMCCYLILHLTAFTSMLSI